MRLRRSIALIATLAAIIPLNACGSSSAQDTARTILEAARDADTATLTRHLTGLKGDLLAAKPSQPIGDITVSKAQQVSDTTRVVPVGYTVAGEPQNATWTMTKNAQGEWTTEADNIVRDTNALVSIPNSSDDDPSAMSMGGTKIDKHTAIYLPFGVYEIVSDNGWNTYTQPLTLAKGSSSEVGGKYTLDKDAADNAKLKDTVAANMAGLSCTPIQQFDENKVFGGDPMWNTTFSDACDTVAGNGPFVTASPDQITIGDLKAPSDTNSPFTATVTGTVRIAAGVTKMTVGSDYGSGNHINLPDNVGGVNRTLVGIDDESPCAEFSAMEIKVDAMPVTITPDGQATIADSYLPTLAQEAFGKLLDSGI